VNCRATVKLLHEMTTLRLGEPPPSNEKMLAAIEDTEARFSAERSFELELVLGGALYTYVFNCVRGNARRTFLERIVSHWERALSFAQAGDWDVLPRSRLRPEIYVRAILGSFLVREALVRDLNKALTHLECVRCATEIYVPELCSYADALYKRGDYLACAKMAAELQARIATDPEWRNVPEPPALSRLRAQGYRAEAKKQQKLGDVQRAAEMYSELVGTGAATPNDLRMRKRLNTLLVGRSYTSGAP
jgi:hypothetical protein